MMPEDEKKNILSRRTALKTLVGAVTAFPILDNQALEAALHVHRRLAQATPAPDVAAIFQLKFFTSAENELVTIISDLIIPTDKKSPGAREARVNEFIDLMNPQRFEVGESTNTGEALRRVGAEIRARNGFVA